METTSHADLHQPPLAPASNLPVENGGPRESHRDDDRCAKKPKLEEHVDGGGGGGGGGEEGGGGELKRVAEIVLVLSTMATMRAGRKPTDVEVELMREARSKLAELCVGLAPKDIVAREAIGTVIEDLGLNGRVTEQRLGFRPPKMSIAEKYTHAKRKMEEANRYAASSTTYTSQPVQPSTSVTADNRVAPHGVRVFAPDNSNHIAIPSSATTVSIPAHVSAGSSAASQYQSTSNEVRPPMVSGAIPSTHLGRNSSPMVVPKLENPQVRADGGSNGSSYVLSIPANSSANQPLANAPPWSIQTQSASLARTPLENKVPAHNTVKVQGTSDVAASRAGSQITADQSFRPFITQTAPVNLSTMQQSFQGVNVAQPPSIPTHAEIAKIVQKLLQPKLPEHPTWTPPSRDYMNKALTCQVCELTVNEVDTVLLCDACEKGYHLKCLQPSVLRGIHNRVDWHCIRCLNLSGGKPLPPKYGRVMRSSNTPPKLPTNTVGVQQPSEKKTGSLDPKVSQQNLTTNGSTVPIVATSNVKVEPPSDSKTPGIKDMHGTGSSNTEHIDQKPDPNISMKSLNAASVPSVDFPAESSAQQINPEPSTCKESSTSKECLDSKTLPKLSEPGKCDNLQSSQDFQAEQKVSQGNAVVLSDKKVDSSLMSNEQKEPQSGESSTYDTKRDGQDVALANFDGSFGINSEVIQHSVLSSDSSQAVEWIGDFIHIVDEKKFYKSCCVDGVTYRLHSHALLPSGHGKLAPSKLQSMWEDCKTGLKWVKVTKCYFPGDLPGNIGHPCISEVNEVYESNSERIEMASSIRGPCEVLPSDKFNQENDRRNQLGIEAKARIQPLFVCRWFYDEIKKLFQPVTS